MLKHREREIDSASRLQYFFSWRRTSWRLWWVAAVVVANRPVGAGRSGCRGLFFFADFSIHSLATPEASCPRLPPALELAQQAKDFQIKPD
jgi:hypothetical protein